MPESGLWSFYKFTPFAEPSTIDLLIPKMNHAPSERSCGGSIAAHSRLSIGELAKIPDLRQLGAMAIAEAINLANAKGLSFGDDEITKFDSIIYEVSVSKPGWRPSLLQDLDAGRPLELDAWCGGAVKIGRELGIDTPVNFARYAGLKPYENGR